MAGRVKVKKPLSRARRAASSARKRTAKASRRVGKKSVAKTSKKAPARRKTSQKGVARKKTVSPKKAAKAARKRKVATTKAAKKPVRKTKAAPQRPTKVAPRARKAVARPARRPRKPLPAPPPRKVAVKRHRLSAADKLRLKRAAELRQAEERQATQYGKGVQYLNARKFDRALTYFEKAADGPDLTLRQRARVHAKICRQQKRTTKVRLKTAEDYYNFGIRLINERRLEEAGRHLVQALKLQPRAAHIHFAAALVGALSGDSARSYASLKKAIQLDPSNRVLALNDVDFAAVLSDPSIAELLHEEGHTS